MKLINIGDVDNPIVYIAMAFISASLAFALLESRYIWLAVLTVGLFFIFIKRSSNYIFTIIVALFFSLSIANNYIYYGLNIEKDFCENVIVTEKKAYYTVASYKGRLLSLEGKLENIKVGQEIEAVGDFNKSVDFENGTLGSLKVSKVKGIHDTYRRKLYELREEVYERLKNNIGDRKSALISSAAFGYTDNLDKVDKGDMQNFGVIHAISVSGLHVSLVFNLVKSLVGGKIGLLITLIYVLLTGAAFSSIRALIMITMLNSAVIFKKKYNPLGAIAFSSILITMIKPYAPYKMGFQLSFLAALGIILFSKSINKRLYRLPKYLNDTFSISVAAEVLTIPIMLTKFGECSLLFLAGNLILVPLLNVIIYLGNFMLITVKIPIIFDFLSYVALKVVGIFDFINDELNLFLGGNFYLNKNMMILYCFLLLSTLFYVKGFKKAKIIPLIVFVQLLISIYSPILRIDYLKEGGFLVAYRGERRIVTNSRNVDMKKLKERNIAEEGYRKAEKVSIGDDITLSLEKKNYILKLKADKYLLRLNNKENIDGNYDIIDFVNKEADGFYIINDKLYCF